MRHATNRRPPGRFLSQVPLCAGSAAITVRDNPALRPTNPRLTLPVLVEGNTLVNNLVGINLFASDGSRAVNNEIQGGGTETGFSNEGGIALSGDGVGVISNRISNSSIGINLLAGPQHGTASNAKVIANWISSWGTPINEQPGVTGTEQYDNVFVNVFGFKTCAITRLEDGSVQVTAQISTCRNYFLETSSDLKSWTTVASFEPDPVSCDPDVAYEWVSIDPDVANFSQRFYRVRRE